MQNVSYLHMFGAVQCRLDLRDIRVVTKLGGTVDDSEMVEGMVFDQKAAKAAGGPTRVENAKIALVQFHISPPKTDIENNVIISDYAQVSALGRRQSQEDLKWLCSKLLWSAQQECEIIGPPCFLRLLQSAADGGRFLACADGPHPEGGAQLHPADGEEDPGQRCQCAAHTEVHPAGCDDGPVTALPGASRCSACWVQ